MSTIESSKNEKEFVFYNKYDSGLGLQIVNLNIEKVGIMNNVYGAEQSNYEGATYYYMGLGF